MIFDGRAFAKEIESEVAYKVRNFVKKPKIVSVLVGDDPASALYTKLKKSAAERVGIVFDVIKLDVSSQILDVRKNVEQYGRDKSVTGVMVQLPIPGLTHEDQQKVVAAIPLAKDVDGLLWERSGVKPAAVRAVLSILERIEKDAKIKMQNANIVVLGAGGAVGRPLVTYLREMGVAVGEIEHDTPQQTVSALLADAQVVISCVGKAGLVQAEMVRDGLIAIDVGMSEVDGKIVGDMTREVYQKASVAVPVPGGVGPVTVASLMANAGELYVKIS